MSCIAFKKYIAHKYIPTYVSHGYFLFKITHIFLLAQFV